MIIRLLAVPPVSFWTVIAKLVLALMNVTMRPSAPPVILEIVCAEAPLKRKSVPVPIAKSVSVPPVVKSAVAPFWKATFPAFVTVRLPATETVPVKVLAPVTPNVPANVNVSLLSPIWMVSASVFVPIEIVSQAAELQIDTLVAVLLPMVSAPAAIVSTLAVRTPPSNRAVPSTSRVPSIYASSPSWVRSGVPLPTFRLPVSTLTNPAAWAVVRVMLPEVVVCNCRLPDAVETVLLPTPLIAKSSLGCNK